jgi:hypothetical protein
MDTYTETVLRYVVEYLEHLPESHRAAMRINGIDPDENWCLEWSFDTEEEATRQLQKSRENHRRFCDRHGFDTFKKYRVRDLGETKIITRVAMFF